MLWFIWSVFYLFFIIIIYTINIISKFHIKIPACLSVCWKRYGERWLSLLLFNIDIWIFVCEDSLYHRASNLLIYGLFVIWSGYKRFCFSYSMHTHKQIFCVWFQTLRIIVRDQTHAPWDCHPKTHPIDHTS